MEMFRQPWKSSIFHFYVFSRESNRAISIVNDDAKIERLEG